MWEDEENTVSTQSPAAMTSYREAVAEFTRNANKLIEHVPLFAKARNAYEQAMRSSAEVRDILESGDETLRILMTDLEQAFSLHAGRTPFERRTAEPSPFEPPLKSDGRVSLAVNE